MLDRCLVPDCETAADTKYKPIWLGNAVPFKENQPSRCKRFQIKNEKESRSTGDCDSNLFNYNVIEDCDEFVYDTKHTTIIQDVTIPCSKIKKDTGLNNFIFDTDSFKSGAKYLFDILFSNHDLFVIKLASTLIYKQTLYHNC